MPFDRAIDPVGTSRLMLAVISLFMTYCLIKMMSQMSDVMEEIPITVLRVLLPEIEDF